MDNKLTPSEVLCSADSNFLDDSTIDTAYSSAKLKTEMPLILPMSENVCSPQLDESESDNDCDLRRSKTNDKVDDIFDSIHSRRDKLNEIALRSENLSKKLETKISTYLDNSKNLPAVGITVEVLDSLSSLYKIESDTQERIIKSLEKEAELVKKFESDADHEEDVAYKHGELLKALEEMRSRQDNPISFRGENIG